MVNWKMHAKPYAEVFVVGGRCAKILTMKTGYKYVSHIQIFTYWKILNHEVLFSKELFC